MTYVKLKEIDLNGTLIIPTISIGNLPQLTIDLLISSLNLEKIGYLDHTYLHPFISPLDSSLPGISLPLEVFHSIKHNLTLIQQRSPIISGFLNQHLQLLNPFISKFNTVFLLDSVEGISCGTGAVVDEYEWSAVVREKIGEGTGEGIGEGIGEGTGEGTGGGTIGAIGAIGAIGEDIEELPFKQTSEGSRIEGDQERESVFREKSENRVKAVSTSQFFSPSEGPSNIQIFSSEEILADSLKHLSLIDSESKFSKFTQNICKNSMTVIVSSIYEGDNIYDAELLGEKLLNLLNIPFTWKRPVSWEGVYGDKEASNAMEDGLYG